MNRQFKKIGVCRAICTLIFLALSLSLLRERAHWTPASDYFAYALTLADVSGTFSVRGREYVVEGGSVHASNGKRALLSERWAALRVAYTHALAERSPVLGIVGTDPIRLQTANEKLARTVELLANRQEDKSKEELARSLYPTTFLSALALLEQSRLDFLSSPSDILATRYHRLLSMTLESQKRASAHFYEKLQDALSGKEGEVRLTFGGGITSETLFHSARIIMVRAEEVTEVSQLRSDCLAGFVSACNVRQVLLPSAADLGSEEEASISPEIRSLLERRNRIEVVLSESVCVKTTSGPYHLLVDTGSPSPLILLNELYFSPTDRVGGVLKYLREIRDISFVPATPMTYYLCPELWRDAGMAYGLAEIGRLKMKYPELLQERHLLTNNGAITEQEAAQYVRAGLEQSNHDPLVRGEFIAAALMLQERSAHLDKLVAAVAGVLQTDMNLYDSGAPLNLSIEDLYLSHSSFPSLFLSHNPSAGSLQVHLYRYAPEDIDTFLTQRVSYEKAIEAVGRERLTHDMANMKAWEGEGRNMFTEVR